jgi:hypothetical protein
MEMAERYSSMPEAGLPSAKKAVPRLAVMTAEFGLSFRARR